MQRGRKVLSQAPAMFPASKSASAIIVLLSELASQVTRRATSFAFNILLSGLIESGYYCQVTIVFRSSVYPHQLMRGRVAILLRPWRQLTLLPSLERS